VLTSSEGLLRRGLEAPWRPVLGGLLDEKNRSQLPYAATSQLPHATASCTSHGVNKSFFRLAFSPESLAALKASWIMPIGKLLRSLG